jgi:hypothetical protein
MVSEESQQQKDDKAKGKKDVKKDAKKGKGPKDAQDDGNFFFKKKL